MSETPPLYTLAGRENVITVLNWTELEQVGSELYAEGGLQVIPFNPKNVMAEEGEKPMIITDPNHPDDLVMDMDWE